DEAIRRANAYLEAGADLAFVEGPTSVEEVRRVCREVKGRVFYNQTGVSPRFSLAQMQELGIAVTIVPGATFRATIEAVYDLAVALRDEGPLAEEGQGECPRESGHHLRRRREHREHARGVACARRRPDDARGLGARRDPHRRERRDDLLVRVRGDGLVRAAGRPARRPRLSPGQ